jgi:prepilin-type N-terminal cleavage/methylation domain-containing protein
MKTSPSTRGFSLLEVLVALAVFGFTAVALIDELNASLALVARQTTRLQDALVIQRGFGLLDAENWKTAKEDKAQGKEAPPSGQGPVRFPPLPWIDEELEQTTPRLQTEVLTLTIEDFPQMLGVKTWLEKKNETGALQTLGERLVLQEDPKTMESFKNMLQSGKTEEGSKEKAKEHASGTAEPAKAPQQPKESP